MRKIETFFLNVPVTLFREYCQHPLEPKHLIGGKVRQSTRLGVATGVIMSPCGSLKKMENISPQSMSLSKRCTSQPGERPCSRNCALCCPNCFEDIRGLEASCCRQRAQRSMGQPGERPFSRSYALYCPNCFEVVQSLQVICPQRRPTAPSNSIFIAHT